MILKNANSKKHNIQLPKKKQKKIRPSSCHYAKAHHRIDNGNFLPNKYALTCCLRQEPNDYTQSPRTHKK